MSAPFFSIIMPCHNDGAYLPKALSAIAAQTFRDFELCFVNDASTDNSEEVIFAFMKEHPDIPVNYWKKEGKNQGASLSKNQGMYMARGEYILFNDADDWMDEDHLELGYGHLKDKTLDILLEVSVRPKAAISPTFAKPMRSCCIRTVPSAPRRPKAAFWTARISCP